MGKNKFQGHAPRPTKGELHQAAQRQHKADEAKLDLDKPTGEKVEIPASEVATVKEVIGAVLEGDQEKAAALIVSQVQPPPTSEEQAKAVDALITEGKVTTPPAPPKGDPTLFTIGKKYSPKTDRNSETWGKITKLLADGPKTMGELIEAVKGHRDFLGYMTRGGHIIPHVAKEVAAQAAAN